MKMTAMPECMTKDLGKDYCCLSFGLFLLAVRMIKLHAYKYNIFLL